MRYFIALVFPPLALLLIGKPAQALISFVACMFIFSYPLASLHAILAVADSNANSRTNKIIKAIKDDR